jgi:ubiquinol-cytochrome c reductase cytochrome c subunit
MTARRPSSPLPAVAFALALSALVVALQAAPDASAQTSGSSGSSGETPAARPPPAPVAAELTSGRELYLTSCVSCHGAEGTGTADGPSLRASGEAKADFYLRTGRMPLTVPVPQPPAKPPAFDDAQIRQLVGYVGSLCDPANPCPAIPGIPLTGPIAEGQELYLANCAPCHNSVAVGGALSLGRHAPSLQSTPPLQVAEAVRTGPGQMPRFGPDVLTDEQVSAVVGYVTYLHDPQSPGGLPLGFTGPVAEGFVALLLGLGLLLLVTRWITREPAGHADPVREPERIER